MVTGRARAIERRRLVAAAAAFAVVSVPLIYMLLRHSSHEFSDFAVAAHLRYVNGAAPLDVATAQPELVSRWFAGRLPFQFKHA